MEKSKLKNTSQINGKLNSENQLNQSYQRLKPMYFKGRVLDLAIASIVMGLKFLMKKLILMAEVLINLILQLLFIRIAKFKDLKGNITGYGVIRWVIPFTGWIKYPLYIGVTHATMLIRTGHPDPADEIVKEAESIINPNNNIIK